MNPPMPKMFKVGTAKRDGDCFFDSVAQCLQQSLKQQRQKCSIKSLRKICAQHAKKSLHTHSWLKTELENEMQGIDEYSKHVVYCAEDIEHKTHLPMKDLIWGRPHIEGRIICSIFKVKLHVNLKEMTGDIEMWVDQVVDSNGRQPVCDIDYDSKHMIHIIFRGNGQYEPVLQRSFVRKHIDFLKREGTTAIKGHLYEIKLSMLFLLRGLREADNFKLASNVKGAGAFDDVIFQYTKIQDGITKSKTIFLQAKHKDDDKNKEIGLDHLLAKKDFSLMLYFASYLDIKNKFLNPKSKDGIFGGNFEDCEFIIYTNIKVHTDLDHNSAVSKVEWNGTELGKMIGSRKGHIVQVKNDMSSIANRLCGGVKLLAQKIFDFTFGENKGKEITNEDEIVTDYHISMANEVFKMNINNPKESGFKEEFVNVKDPGEAKILFDELFMITNPKSGETEDSFRQKLQNAKVNLFPLFGKFPLQMEESSMERLCKKLGKIIINSKSNQIEINHKNCPSDMDRLANNVLVRDGKDGDKEWVKISDGELTGNECLFLEKLKQCIASKCDLYKYRFSISGFPKFSLPKPCNEATENDVNDFLRHLHIFVGQSQENELDEIIKQEIGYTYGENEENSDTIFAKVKNSVEKWWKKEQFFFTKEHQYFLVEKHCIQLNVLRIHESGVQFKEEKIKKLADLIMQHQIVNIVADKGSKLLSLIPITLSLDSNREWNDVYRRWIFMNLDQLLSAESHILQGYYSKKVLVIECTLRSEHFAALQELFRTMQGNENIKMVFITEQFDLRNVCGEYFEVHTEYDKTPFKDLTAQSQNMIWAKKVTFQGKETELSDLIDIKDNTAENVISSQTLMQVIMNDNLIICNEPLRLSNMEAAYSKLYTEISVDALVQILLKKWDDPALFLIRGIKEDELLNVLTMVEGSEDADVVMQKIQNGDIIFRNETQDKMCENFKELCAQENNRIVHWFEAVYGHFYLQMLYNPKFYMNRTFIYPGKVSIKIDVLLQSNLSKTFVFDCESRQQEVRNLLATCTVEDQKQYENLCNEKRIRFLKSEDKAKFQYNSVQNKDANKSVYWLTVNEGDQDNFAMHICQGPLQGYCKCGKILYKDENSKICSKDQHIHYLTIEENDLIWKRSNGSFEWLRDNAEIEYETLDEEQFSDLDKGRFVIIADDPGMGKSATLTSLSERMHETNWVIRIDFRECNTAIQKLQSNAEHLKMENVRDFISGVNSTGFQSDLGKQLLLHKLNTNASQHRPILILFDAFDEIDSEQQKTIIILLKFLKNESSAKVWVTTRRNNVQELENSLLTFATKLAVFNEREQVELLCKFWRIQNFNGNLMKYAGNLLTISKTFLGEEMILFMGVPLQLRMLAEVFHNDALNSQAENKSDLNLEGLNIISMYQRFISVKYDIYFREKSLLINHSQYIMQSVSKSFNRMHQYIAFNMLFPKELELISESKLPSADDKILLKSVGIIQSNGSEDNIYFIHRTFAEYFVANFLYGNLMKSTKKFQSTIQYLQKQMFDEANVVILRFLDRLLVEKFPMHLAALEDDMLVLIEKFSENNDTIEFDLLRRTPLHLSAREGNLKLVKVLLDNGYDHRKCDVFGKTPLHYATINEHVDVVQHLLNYTADIDIHRHVLRLAFQVNLEFGCNITPAETENLSSNLAQFVNQQDKNGQSSLLYAAAKQYWNIACILIANGADIRTLTEENQNSILEYASQYRFSIRDESLLVIGLLLKFPHNFYVKGLKDECNWNTLNPDEKFLTCRNLRIKYLKTYLTNHFVNFEKDLSSEMSICFFKRSFQCRVCI